MMEEYTCRKAICKSAMTKLLALGYTYRYSGSWNFAMLEYLGMLRIRNIANTHEIAANYRTNEEQSAKCDRPGTRLHAAEKTTR